MSITGKDLAKKLNISEAAISMALNNKAGVSTQTRNKIIEEAHKLGYDFTKIKKSSHKQDYIYLIIFRKHGAVVTDTPFFNALSESIQKTCEANGYKFIIRHILSCDDMKEQLEINIGADCAGLIILGTEMHSEDFFPFSYINTPTVLLDSYFNSTKMDCVIINNREGAYKATQFLINKCHCQPGYLHSSYSIFNFTEREEGFNKAILNNGMSVSNSIIHMLSPSMDGAYADMKAIIDNNEKLAKCYFADNDLIAAGAIRAFKEAGYRIPEDIAIIGFDNMPLCNYIDPHLTTVNVPVKYMGEMAVDRLLHVITSHHFLPVTIQISTNIIKRESV